MAANLGIATFFAPNEADLATHEFQSYIDDPIPPGQDLIDFPSLQVTIGANVLTVDSVEMLEGSDDGLTSFVFTVTHIPALTGTPLPAADFTWSTSTDGLGPTDVAATPGVDFVPRVDVPVHFNEGQATTTITVQVRGDRIDEPDEKFSIKLTAVSGAPVSSSPGIGKILDDDALPGLRIEDATGPEADQAPLEFVVTMFNLGVEGPSGKTVTVQYRTEPSTGAFPATAGTDYVPVVSGTLTFNPGDTQQTILITARNDDERELNPETFHVVLFSPSEASLTDATAVGTITDVSPVEIQGYVFVDNNPDGIKGLDLKGNPEVGIANVRVTATRDDDPSFEKIAFTNANGLYTLNVPPGTYTVTETQPGFFNDGIDMANGQLSAANDQYTGIQVGGTNPSLAAGYNFGEANLRNDFVMVFFNRRALFASAIFGGGAGMASTATNLNPRGGDIWISFDGGWQGLRTITATAVDPSQGGVTMTLYNNALVPIGTSVPTPNGARLQYSGTIGSAYFLKLTGTNPNVTLQIDPAAPSSAGPLFAPSASTFAGAPSVPANSSPPALPGSAPASPLTRTSMFASSQETTPMLMASASETTDAALADDDDWVSDSLAG